MSDRETIIKGCENWLNNHKGENYLLTYSSVVELLALLKEQEAVKVEKRKEETEWNVCSNCGGHLISKWTFCPYCGRTVKWDE